METLSLAIKAAREWDQAQTKEKASPPPPNAPPPVHLPGPLTVVRTDVAWRKEDKKAGIGWTLHSQEGSLQEKKAVLFVASPLMAEGLAIREALLFCKTLGIQSVRLESDCLLLINALNRMEPISELHGVLSDIAALCSSSLFSTLFVWIPRNQNVVADSLAKAALCMSETIMAPT